MANKLARAPTLGGALSVSKALGRVSSGRPPSAARQRVIEIAPQHPPCFGGQEAWLGWLIEADLSADENTRVTVPGKVGFNMAINFCIDCVGGIEKRRIQAEGRCKPDFLRKQVGVKP